MGRWIRIVFLLLVLLTTAACHSMRFEVNGVADPVPSRVERKAFYVWGLAPTRTVDLAEVCPDGTAVVQEETNFVDGLLSLITLGIYSPRTSKYYCLEGS